MLQLVLEFLQAILGEGEEETDALVGIVLGIANLARFDHREIVFLPRCSGTQERPRREDERTQEEKISSYSHRSYSPSPTASPPPPPLRTQPPYQRSPSLPL